jgi:putative uncharacterized protein (fragment)
MKILKNKNAITLIALVITIIIMLLLAGVAIQMTIGENGLIAKSTQAKSQQAKSELYETAKLSYLNLKAKSIEAGLTNPTVESILSETDFLNKYNVVGDNITNKNNEIIDTKDNLIKYIKNNEPLSSNSDQLILELNVISSGVLEFYCSDSDSSIEIEYHDNSKEIITSPGYHAPSTTKNYNPGKYKLKLKGLNNNHLNGLSIISYADMNVDILDWGKAPNKQTGITLPNINNIISPEPDYLTVHYYQGKFNSIPNDLFSQKINNEIMSCFSYCDNITSIPEDLFKNCINAKEFDYTFAHCNNLKNIPENIFKYNTNVETFSRTFAGFSGSSIPENLFKYNTKVKTFDNVFYGTDFKTVPENLFKYNINVESFWQLFENSKLETVPENLFKYNTKATSFGMVFYYTELKSIPENIFKYNIKAEDFYGTFAHSKISSIPENLFNNNPNINNLKSTFEDCRKLTTIPQTIINKALSTTEHREIFRYCNSASNYDSLPEILK